jgi:hypothetical protein
LRRHSFFPPRPIVSLPSFLGIKFFAAELPHERLGVLGVSEAIDIPPLAFMKDHVTTGAQRQVIAERANGLVAAVEQYRGRQRDLVRPSAVYSGAGEFAFAVHHAEMCERARSDDVNIASHGGGLAGERLDIAPVILGAVPHERIAASLNDVPAAPHWPRCCVAKELAVAPPELVATARHPDVMTLKTLADVRAFMRHLLEDRLQRQMWRHVALQLKQAAADGDTTKVAVSLRVVLSMEGVECRPQ